MKSDFFFYFKIIIITFSICLFEPCFSQEKQVALNEVERAPLIAFKIIPTSCLSFVCPVFESAIEMRIRDNKSLELSLGYGKLPSLLQSQVFNDIFYPRGSSNLTDFKISFDYRWLKVKRKPNFSRFNSIGFFYYSKDFSFPTNTYFNSTLVQTNFNITRYGNIINYKFGRILKLNSYLNLEMYLGFGFEDYTETHHGGAKEVNAPYKYSFKEGENFRPYFPFGIKICYYKN